MCYISILYIINTIILEIEIGKKQGYVILDDETGKIMSVMVRGIIGDKFDFISKSSFKREGKKHYTLKTKQVTTNEINEAYNKFSSSEYYE